MFFPPERRSLNNKQKLRCTARYLSGERDDSCRPHQPWKEEFVWRRLTAETLTTYPSARLMGEYPITLHSRKSPKSPAWIFDERRVGWPITKRHLSPIPLTEQPWLILSLGNQKQTFHGWKYPFRKIIDAAVMYVWTTSLAPCWECIRIQNLIQT